MLDLVWNEYIQGSLKAYALLTWGKGGRRRVEPSNAVPKNWMEFLKNEENKIELFSFLSLETSKLHTESQIIITWRWRKLESSCFPKKEEQWKLFHQQKLHSENIQRELGTNVRNSSQSMYLLQVIEGGYRQMMEAGR